MGMEDPKPTYTYLVTRIKELYPHFAYIHVIEPRANGSGDRAPGEGGADDSNDFIRDIWGDRPLISAGGYARETALRQAEERPNELIAFGRWYISNVRIFFVSARPPSLNLNVIADMNSPIFLKGSSTTFLLPLTIDLPSMSEEILVEKDTPTIRLRRDDIPYYILT